MSAPTELAENAGFLHLSFKGFQGPVDAVTLAKLDFWHVCPLRCWAEREQNSPRGRTDWFDRAASARLNAYGSTTHARHVLGGRALLTLDDVELDAFTFRERL